MNDARRVNEKIGPIKNTTNNKLEYDNKKIADIFVEQFASVFTKSDKNNQFDHT